MEGSSSRRTAGGGSGGGGGSRQSPNESFSRAVWRDEEGTRTPPTGDSVSYIITDSAAPSGPPSRRASSNAMPGGITASAAAAAAASVAVTAERSTYRMSLDRPPPPPDRPPLDRPPRVARRIPTGGSVEASSRNWVAPPPETPSPMTAMRKVISHSQSMEDLEYDLDASLDGANIVVDDDDDDSLYGNPFSTSRDPYANPFKHNAVNVVGGSGGDESDHGGGASVFMEKTNQRATARETAEVIKLRRLHRRRCLLVVAVIFASLLLVAACTAIFGVLFGPKARARRRERRIERIERDRERQNNRDNDNDQDNHETTDLFTDLAGQGEKLRDCQNINPLSQCACAKRIELDRMDADTRASYERVFKQLGPLMGYTGSGSHSGNDDEELVDPLCSNRNQALWWSAMDEKLHRRTSSPQETIDPHMLQRHVLIYLFAAWEGASWNMTFALDFTYNAMVSSSVSGRSNGGDQKPMQPSPGGSPPIELDMNKVWGLLDYDNDKDNKHHDGVSECEWFGVGCNANGEVELLNLGMLGLSGSIPTQIALLTSLRLLLLNDNGLYGTFPTEMFTMSSLTTVDVADNFFEGKIPMEVSKLVNLQKLSLRENYFTGSVPPQLFQLTDMRDLDLHSNQLTGQIPENFGTFMTLLRTVDLASNSFSGTLPSTMSRLTRLKEFSLHDTDVSGRVPGALLATLKDSLFHLRLDSNFFVGTLPTELAQLTLLTYFDIRNNFLTGPIPTEFANLKRAELVSFELNNFTSTIPTELGLMTGLQSIHFSNTLLEGTVPRELCGLYNRSLQTMRAYCAPDLECPCCTEPDEGIIDCDEEEDERDQ